jgi:hypothetical protein
VRKRSVLRNIGVFEYRINLRISAYRFAAWPVKQAPNPDQAVVFLPS